MKQNIQVAIFYFSGISFALYNLAKYPEIQQKVFEEARAVFGDDVTKPVTMHNLNDLRYLELVIKETLRLYPSVPFFGRKIREEITIGDFTFPEETSVLIAPFFMQRDPNIFQDPLKFDPERFNVETNYEKTNPFSYVPFSAGPRNCKHFEFSCYCLSKPQPFTIHFLTVFI
jgi:cytochrome P450 family 4